jgi:hypothetical protein
MPKLFFDQKNKFFGFLAVAWTLETNLLAFARRKRHPCAHENANAPLRHLYHRNYQLAHRWLGRFRLTFTQSKIRSGWRTTRIL